MSNDKPDNEKKTATLNIRITAEEKNEFRVRAKLAGFDDVSGWILWLARNSDKAKGCITP